MIIVGVHLYVYICVIIITWSEDIMADNSLSSPRMSTIMPYYPTPLDHP